MKAVIFSSADLRIWHIIGHFGLTSVYAASAEWKVAKSTLLTVLKDNVISTSTAERLELRTGFKAAWIEHGAGPMRDDIPPGVVPEFGAPPG